MAKTGKDRNSKDYLVCVCEWEIITSSQHCETRHSSALNATEFNLGDPHLIPAETHASHW